MALALSAGIAAQSQGQAQDTRREAPVGSVTMTGCVERWSAGATGSGTIGSAALNWATQTPLARDHPLWDAPNLILAPWAGTMVAPSQGDANQVARENEMRWLVIRENMRRFASGEKMFSVFDIARGY